MSNTTRNKKKKSKKKKPKSNSLTILGSGTSTGVPILGCKCSTCRSKDPKNNRLRASVWFQVNGYSFLVDTSPDLRQQAMRAKIDRVDAVLYTHPHNDHVSGIDDLRAYNFHQGESIPVYGNQWTYDDLIHRFAYIFDESFVSEGGGVPKLELQKISGDDDHILIKKVKIIPLTLPHGSYETLGFRIGSVAYLTDCSDIPDKSLEKLKNLSTLVLDCVRLKPHRTHLNLARAMDFVEIIRPKRCYLTHLSHDFEHKTWNKRLPKGVQLAYDGLKINF